MNHVIQVSVDELGRIVIPAALHERLHLAPGMTLVVEKGEQGGVRLRIQSKPTVLVEKEGLLVARVTALSNLANVTRHERDRRIFDLLQRVGL
jgi:AbrB family looped-hinge helix DNA binding protein